MVPTAGQSVSHPAAGAVVLRGPPQQASGQTAAPQIAARATYANAYKPPDAPLRRPLPPNTDPYEPVGVRSAASCSAGSNAWCHPAAC